MLRSEMALTALTPTQTKTAAAPSKEKDFTAGKRRTTTAGKHVLSENDIWEIVLEVWEKLQSSEIASAYVQAYRIAGKLVEAEGGNEFLGIGGTTHVGIRKDLYPTIKGLDRKDIIHMPAPPPAAAEVDL